jgi:spore coat protein U-like protein
MKRFSLSRLFLVLAAMAVIFSWTPHKPADALVIDQAVLVIGARVDTRCMILATPINFGGYSTTNPVATDADGSITVDCDNAGVNNSNRIRINQGNSPAAGSTAANPRRQMTGGDLGTGRLRYDLYQDAARTLIWGDTMGTAVFPGGGPYPLQIPVYGRIPALQSELTALPGAYQDVAVVTMYF